MISRVRFVLTRDPEQFAARTEALLAGSLECNVLATVLMSARQNARPEAPPLFAVGLTGEDEVSFAAMRTPPFPLLTSPLGTGDAEPLIERWLELDPDVSSVSGVMKCVASFVMMQKTSCPSFFTVARICASLAQSSVLR